MWDKRIRVSLSGRGALQTGFWRALRKSGSKRSSRLSGAKHFERFELLLSHSHSRVPPLSAFAGFGFRPDWNDLQGNPGWVPDFEHLAGFTDNFATELAGLGRALVDTIDLDAEVIDARFLGRFTRRRVRGAGLIDGNVHVAVA
jgi:hypothetical protein